MKPDELPEHIARLEANQANLSGWLKDISDRVKQLERHVWYGVGLLTAVQLFLRYFAK